nr:MAG TPA: hypothetical protein [Bacteriophage sp.]
MTYPILIGYVCYQKVITNWNQTCMSVLRIMRITF